MNLETGENQYNGPLIETTLQENLTIKRFLGFVIKDVEYQRDMSVKDSLESEEKEDIVYTSSLLLNYLRVLLSEVEVAINETSIGTT